MAKAAPALTYPLHKAPLPKGLLFPSYRAYLSQLGDAELLLSGLPVLPRSASCTLRALQDSEELIYHIQGTPRLS